ncbi:hypothetical protein KCP76_20205 [Salmonella enterica subsp. enterica serovar Weltevreden]|nr:hypothetical protein KCP76_20205 [Salmonella enterica subsp. enterica serovar Weltevreden]
MRGSSWPRQRPGIAILGMQIPDTGIVQPVTPNLLPVTDFASHPFGGR